MSNAILISNMNILGANVTELPNESTKDFHLRMVNQYNHFYENAKTITPASSKQYSLCEDLLDCGAPCDLKESHVSSMAAADAFIKANYHLLKNPTPDSVRANQLKPTTKFKSLSDPNHFVYQGNVPSDFNIPNH